MTRILVYHSVAPDGARVERATQVSARAFRSQLAWIRRAGYEVVPVARLREALPFRRGRRLAISFDDGYWDNYGVAWPILRAFGMTATFFVATDFIGDYARFNSDWQPPMMEWAHLRELAAAGMEIGSHTRSHPHLPELFGSALQDELCHSRSVLEAELGSEVRSISYPYGMHSRAVREAVERARYRIGCAVDPEDERLDWLALPRVMVRETDRGPRLALKLSSLYRRLRRTRSV